MTWGPHGASGRGLEYRLGCHSSVLILDYERVRRRKGKSGEACKDELGDFLGAEAVKYSSMREW